MTPLETMRAALDHLRPAAERAESEPTPEELALVMTGLQGHTSECPSADVTRCTWWHCKSHGQHQNRDPECSNRCTCGYAELVAWGADAHGRWISCLPDAPLTFAEVFAELLPYSATPLVVIPLLLSAFGLWGFLP